MLWLFAGVLVVGLAVGFFLAKSRFQAGASPEQQRELAAITAESDSIKNQLSQLQQDKADLRYQLGEAKKSLNYAEQRIEKLQSQRDEN